MTLRFPPHRIACAVLAASLAVPTLHPAFAQSKQPSQDASPYQGEVVEDVVARVNDQVISRSDYARAEQDLENQARQQNWTQQQLFEQKHELLRDLIDRQLLLSKAKELDITGDTELIKRLDELRKQNNLPSMEALQKAAEDQGVSWEDFKQTERNQIISQQVIRQEVGAHVNVTPTELQAYYNDHKQDFSQPEQVQVSEILIPTANPDDAAQVAAAQKKADDLVSQLKSGGDFSALAKANSGGPTAPQGGELGQFKRGALFPSSKDLEDKVFALQAGQFTEPIRTRQGFAILEVTQHTQAGVQPYKDVEAQVEDAVGMAKMGPAMREYLTHLREDAYINIKNGYEDSGASPNEMKPIFSAYEPPQPKKKKKVVRARFHQRGHNTSSAPVETASAPEPSAAPAGTPSLADVPQGNAPAASGTAAAGTATAAATPAAVNGKTRKQQEANAKATKTASTQKAGKKEKIRFGQAPRETLPTAETKTEDAGANTDTSTQVGSNGAAPSNGSNLKVLGPDGTPVAADQVEKKKAKGRFSKHVSGPKVKKADPFAPVAPTSDDVASRQEQGKALGLNGDTTKQKKVSDTKTGPKRRMKNRKKKATDQNQSQPQQAPTPAAQPAANPAPAAPAPQN